MKSASIAAFVLIAGLTATACDTLMVPSTRPISKIESRALPEDAVIRRVVGQLANILSIVPPTYTSAHPVTPLDAMLFWTTARATETPRICRADLVSLDFMPTRKGKPDANTPTRVSGIWAQSRYRYVPEAPGEPNTELTPEQADRQQSICSNLDPYQSRFFVAESEEYALWVARLYGSVVREAATSPQKFAFSCYASDPECGKTFRDIPFTVFGSVVDCRLDGGPPDTACTKYETGGGENLVVQVHTKGYGDNAEIQKVDVDWQLYMSSVRID